MKIAFFTRLVAFLFGLLVSIGVRADMLAPVTPVPGSVQYSTFAIGINDSGVVAGMYLGADQSLHGFYGNPTGAYSYLDAGSHGWVPRGINNRGYVTGFANADTGPPLFQFEISPSGATTAITSNGVQLRGIVQQVNAAGYFVGDYRVSDPTAPEQVNGYYGLEGQYVGDITLPFPTRQTRPRAINNGGDLAGFFIRAGQGQRGFLIRSGIVTVVTYPDPNQTDTVLEGMNDQGTLVGQWVDTAGASHAFILSSDLTTFTSISVAGASSVQAWGINNAGEVTVGTDIGGYIYCSKTGGTCHRLDGASVVMPTIVVPPGSFPTFSCVNGCISPKARDRSLVSPGPRIVN